MSRPGLQLRLRGRSAEIVCKGFDCDCERRLVRGLKERTKELAVAGCSKFGERDGMYVRTELRA
jgi:hypothetical protein